jgi:hypothetical protein
MMTLQDDASRIGKSVVWITILVLSWLCPAVGHAGVTDSRVTEMPFFSELVRRSINPDNRISFKAIISHGHGFVIGADR